MKLEPVSPPITLDGSTAAGVGGRVRLSFFGINPGAQLKLKQAKAAAAASLSSKPVSIMDVDATPMVFYTSRSHTTIGRGSSNAAQEQPDIKLADFLLLSKLHCAIHVIPSSGAVGGGSQQYAPLTFALQDLGSSNGTCIKDVHSSCLSHTVSSASFSDPNTTATVSSAIESHEKAVNAPFVLPPQPSFTLQPTQLHRISPATQVVSFGEHDAVLLRIDDTLYPNVDAVVPRAQLTVISQVISECLKKAAQQQQAPQAVAPSSASALLNGGGASSVVITPAGAAPSATNIHHHNSSTLSAGNLDGDDLLAMIATPNQAGNTAQSLTSTQHDSQQYQVSCSPAPKPQAASPIPETQIVGGPDACDAGLAIPETLVVMDPAHGGGDGILDATLPVGNSPLPDTLMCGTLDNDSPFAATPSPAAVASNTTPQRGEVPKFDNDGTSDDDDVDVTPPKAVSPGSNPLLAAVAAAATPAASHGGLGLVNGAGTGGTMRVNCEETGTSDEEEDVAPPPNMSLKSGGMKRPRDETNDKPSVSPAGSSTQDDGPVPPPGRGGSPVIHPSTGLPPQAAAAVVSASITPSVSPPPPPARGGIAEQAEQPIVTVTSDIVTSAGRGAPAPAVPTGNGRQPPTSTTAEVGEDSPTPKDSDTDADESNTTNTAVGTTTMVPRGGNPAAASSAPAVVDKQDSDNSQSIPQPQPTTPAPSTRGAPAAVVSAPVVVTPAFKWQFKADLRKANKNDKAWQDYPTADSDLMEKHFEPYNNATTAKEKKKLERINLNATYGADFEDLIQYRLDDENRQRPIRRVPQ